MMVQFIICSILFTLLGFVNISQADDINVEKDAARLFEKGVVFFRDENYPAALSFFQQSYLLNAKASVLYNIAMCYKAQYRYVDAIAHFEKFIDLQMEESLELDRARQELEYLKSQLGIFSLLGVPKKAVVRLNGRELDTYALVKLDPGSYYLNVTASGFEEYKLQFSIDAGEELVREVTLIQKKGILSVNCDLQKVSIWINEKFMGNCPLNTSLTPGKVYFKAEAQGWKPYTKVVDIVPGEKLSFFVSFATEGNMRTSTDKNVQQPIPNSPLRTGPDTTTTRAKKFGPLRVAGLVTTTTGALGVALGLAFLIKGEINQARIEESNDQQARLEYNQKVLPLNLAFIASGLIAGSVTLVTGLTLLKINRKRNREKAPNHVNVSRFQLSPMSMSVRF
ncbi:MAG: PEGA domain-containing protein [Deltaproteobacteria bacterium]|nr:PEGA domain-containing protein [Deltaproteobacteria bacterium]